jgi:hypothetical protein
MPIGPQTIEEYASAVLKKSRTLKKGWLRRHWFDIALLLIFSASWGTLPIFCPTKLYSRRIGTGCRFRSIGAAAVQGYWPR